MNLNQIQIKKLDWLPTYGPMALPFSATGHGFHHEGLVVEFQTKNGNWAGNFQPGLTTFNEICLFPNSEFACIVSGGQAYVINPIEKTCIEFFSGFIEGIWKSDQLGVVIYHDGIGFYSRTYKNVFWESKRISWDGFRNIKFGSEKIIGEAWNPDDTWYPFELNVKDGVHNGGAYFE